MGYVGDRLTQLACENPLSPALTCAGQSWTRAQLRHDIEATAYRLLDKVKPGDRVALSLENPAELLISFFAVARIGAIAMIYDPYWPQDRRSWIEDNTRPALVLTDRWTKETIGQESAVVSLPAPPDSDNLFYAGFTSGSTGDPKGYCRTHKSWLESFTVSETEFGINSGDCIVIPGNMVHSLHLYGAVHGVSVGAHVVVMEQFQPKKLARALRDKNTTVLYATPTQLHYIVEELFRRGAAQSLRLVLVSGAKWQEKDIVQLEKVFPVARLVEFYGASEASFIAAACVQDAVPNGSVGRPVHGVQVQIRNRDGGTAQAEHAGRIWVKSDMLFSGYICGGGEEVLQDDAGWLCIGDRGYLDQEGFLYLEGREKRMIVTAGVNVYPEEVEQVLHAHPDIGLAAVVGCPDAVRGSAIVAIVEMIPDREVSQEQLRFYCIERLGLAKTPRKFVFTSSLPLTAGGKVDLKKIEHDVNLATGAER